MTSNLIQWRNLRTVIRILKFDLEINNKYTDVGIIGYILKITNMVMTEIFDDIPLTLYRQEL
jgi:hypothetical protein